MNVGIGTPIRSSSRSTIASLSVRCRPVKGRYPHLEHDPPLPLKTARALSIWSLQGHHPSSKGGSNQKNRWRMKDRREWWVGAVVLLFPVPIQHPDLFNRYRMIWGLNGKTPWNNNQQDWIDYLFFVSYVVKRSRHLRPPR